MGDVVHTTAREARTRAHPQPLAVLAPSLRDAVRQRPGTSEGETITQRALSTIRHWDGTTWVGPGGTPLTRSEIHNANPRNKKRAKDLVIVQDMWTAADFRTFDRLSAMACSSLQSDRQRGKDWLDRFIKKHGREKCDMMLAEIRRRDEVEWFSERHRTRGA